MTIIEKKDFQSVILTQTMRDYQLDGAKYLFDRKAALLCDDPGTGKTVQAISAMMMLKEFRGVSSFLIICPSAVKNQWRDYLLYLTDIGVPDVLVVDKRLRKKKGDDVYNNFNNIFTIINYELVWRDFPLIEQQIYECVVLDEIHRIKSFKSKQSKAIKMLNASYRYGLTGTPIQNDLTDLFSVMQFIDKKILGPWHIFESDHIVKRRIKDLVYVTKRGKKRRKTLYKTVGYKDTASVHNKIRKVMIRRRKEDVLKELPKCLENVYKIEMDKSQYRLYQAVRKSDVIENKAVLFNVLGMISDSPELLLQSNSENIMKLVSEYSSIIKSWSGKLNELWNVINLFDGRRILIFSQYSRMVRLIADFLCGKGIKDQVYTITGEVKVKDRDSLIRKFNEDKNARIMIGTDAIGEGVDGLQNTIDVLVNFDLPYNPAVIAQRIGRLDRMGQKTAVNVIHLVAERTVEERVLKAIERKKKLFEEVIDRDILEEVFVW